MNFITMDTRNILTCFSLLLEILLGLFLLSQAFPQKIFPYRKTLFFLHFVVYSMVMLFQHIVLVAVLEDTYFVFLGMHYLMLFLYGVIFCKGKLYFKFFFPLIYISLLTLASNPMSLFMPTLMNLIPGLAELWMNGSKIFNCIMLVPLILFMLHFKPDTNRSYPVSFSLTMMLTPLLNMASITLLKQPIAENIAQVGTITLFLQMLIYYMIWQSTTEYDKRMQLQLIQQQHNFHEQHMSELRDIVTNYRKLRHDMKNHYACMDRLLSQEKYRALKDYFYSMSNEFYAIDNQIDTGNEIVNQVINIKYATAQRLHIPIKIQAELPNTLEIPDHLICSVLSNLLDNALEASEKIENPEIIVKLHMVKGYFSLTIKNRIESWQEEHAMSHKTSKADNKLHGLGLQIVDETVKKFNGISTFEVEDGYYMASIMLENIYQPAEK